jgi:hypothetical protein
MDLIDRYVHEVGQHLPPSLRADVEAELRSLLTDSVEERARHAGRVPDEEAAADVVRAFGRPRDVAARYAPQVRYLVGPRLYPGYVLAVKIMVAVLAAVVLVLLGLGRYHHEGELSVVGPFIRAAGSFLSTAFFNLSLLTLSFAIVERAMDSRGQGREGWDPATLPPVNDPDRVSYFGRIFVLWATAAVAVLFNFFPPWVAVVVIHNTDVRAIPLLLPEFARYLPLLNVYWAAAFALNLVVLRHGRWRPATRWADLGLTVLNGLILVLVISGPPVFEYDPIVKGVLGMVVLVMAVDCCVRLFRLLLRRRAQPWHPPLGRPPADVETPRA